MTIRWVAEQLSRGIVVRRRLPSQFGKLPIYVTPEASLRFWLSMSKVDSLLYAMAEELVQPGSVVWDIGANVGLFSFCAAARSGSSGFVLAIEPDLWLSSLMIRSARELAASNSSCSQVKALCAGISDSIRVSDLQIAETARASNYLKETGGTTRKPEARYSQPTICLTLDFLLTCFPAPSVLKIDVESHELSVLRGAKNLLENIKPVIWCEVLHENSADVTSLLHEAGYELYAAATRPHEPINQAWFHTLAIAKDSSTMPNSFFMS
jgi:FkbM family methyltransferase